MPNHITSELRATVGPGGKGATLQRFMSRCAAIDPENQHHKSSNRPPFDRLSFWNFVRPDSSVLDAYWATANQDNDTDPNNWYNWNREHWGTKWDAYEVEGSVAYKRSSKVPYEVVYRFQTAWNPPVPVLEAMTKQFPELHLSLAYVDEAGPGGRYEAEAGFWTLVDRFDGPRSHTEAMEPRRILACDCVVSEGSYVPFKDCPEPL